MERVYIEISSTSSNEEEGEQASSMSVESAESSEADDGVENTASIVSDEWVWSDTNRIAEMTTEEIDGWMQKLITASNDLKTKGYAVIENVLTKDECKLLTQYTDEWMRHQEKYAQIYADAKLEELKKTENTGSEDSNKKGKDKEKAGGEDEVEEEEVGEETNDPRVKWCKIHHIMQTWGFNSSKFAREMRRHPLVCCIFRALYGNRCDLLSSQDRVNVLRTGETSAPRGQWPHIDLNPRKELPNESGIVLQAYVSITAQPTDEHDVEHGVSGNRFYVKKKINEDGSVEFIGTQVGFVNRWKHRRTANVSDWYKLYCDDLEDLKNEGFELVKPSHGPGAMVLWDSRCVHDPFAQTISAKEAKEDKSGDIFKRLVFYVCMIPSPIFCKERAKKHEYQHVVFHRPEKAKPTPAQLKKLAVMNKETIEDFFSNEKTVTKGAYKMCDATRHCAYPKIGVDKGGVFDRVQKSRYSKVSDTFVDTKQTENKAKTKITYSHTINTCPFLHYYDTEREEFSDAYVPHRFDPVPNREPSNALERRMFGFDLYRTEKFEMNTMNYMLDKRISEDNRARSDDLVSEYELAEQQDTITFDTSLKISKPFSTMLNDAAAATRLKMCHNFLPLAAVTMNAEAIKAQAAKDKVQVKTRNSNLTKIRKTKSPVEDKQKTTTKRKRTKTDDTKETDSAKSPGKQEDGEEDSNASKKQRYAGKTINLESESSTDVEDGVDDPEDEQEDPFADDTMYQGQSLNYDYNLQFRNLFI